MISDITLGQFFPGYSPIHKMDPRSKILIAIVFIVSVFLANNPISFLFLTLSVLMLVAVSRISFAVVIKGIKPIIIIVIITAIINVFMTKGEGIPLFSFWFIKIYKEGIIRAVFMALRVILLIIGSSILLTYTTSPISLTDGIESLLSPLKAIKVPVHTFAMMMSIALRFIPTLVEETDKIMNAQKSRGADFSSGGLIKRAKALIPILIPLFVSSFKRAEELAVAMESRCYRGDKNRTKLVKLQFRGVDIAFFAITLIFLLALLSLVILPYKLGYSGIVFDIMFYRM
jgi:energy-coupling factor transport system permease protein